MRDDWRRRDSVHQSLARAPAVKADSAALLGKHSGSLSVRDCFTSSYISLHQFCNYSIITTITVRSVTNSKIRPPC